MVQAGELGVDSIRFERVYDASVEDVWALWTTKDGLEEWFAPSRSTSPVFRGTCGFSVRPASWRCGRMGRGAFIPSVPSRFGPLTIGCAAIASFGKAGSIASTQP